MRYDVVVIGGGHAGCEAANAAAKMGCTVALVTLNPERIGFMSCNPAIGGLAKGQLVKEIDALGGLMAINTDYSSIQYRKLNTKKGPSVRASRAQCDKLLYARNMQKLIKKINNIQVHADEVSKILHYQNQISGVELKSGLKIESRQVVITAGTFMSAIMYTGEEKSSGGRVGDIASLGLSHSLVELGFKLQRLKTGTPPRLHRRSIDFSRLTAQPGDEKIEPFSFYFDGDRFPVLPQKDCHITYTNLMTHEIIQENIHRSPMFTGLIKGVGPRYCPSIEDKVVRFSDKERHQIFLEPEGLDVDEIYVNGVSTSLPKDVQDRFIHSIPGLENAEFIRYGYAVEYDSVDSMQLKTTLESKTIQGLFLAGQVNGTSGYEEAGAQGLIAGINAGCLAKEKDPFTLTRLDAYIGVLVDDLILKGTDEPYRMFTSRAEYRLILREDNADLRLSEKAIQLGLLSKFQVDRFHRRQGEIKRLRGELKAHFFLPSPSMNEEFNHRGFPVLKDRISAEGLLKRPEVDWETLCTLGFAGSDVDSHVSEQVEIQTKYEGYIQRDLEMLEGVRKNEEKRIPLSIDFKTVPGLSNEIKHRLNEVRPESIGQMSRIRGVTPAAVANMLIYLKINQKQPKPPSYAQHDQV